MEIYQIEPFLVGHWIQWTVKPGPFMIAKSEVKAISLYRRYIKEFTSLFSNGEDPGLSKRLLSVRKFYDWLREIYSFHLERSLREPDVASPTISKTTFVQKRKGFVLTNVFIMEEDPKMFLQALAFLIQGFEKQGITVIKPIYLAKAFETFGVLVENSPHISRYWDEYVDYQIQRHKQINYFFQPNLSANLEPLAPKEGGGILFAIPPKSPQS